MIKIAICDDDMAIVLQVKKFFQAIEENDYPAGRLEILTFSSGLELLERYPEELDILFLDIQMPGMNGIQIAQEIRQNDEYVTLIFMTNYVRYAVQGYTVHAYNYLLKPLNLESFRQEILPLLKRFSIEAGKSLSLKNDSGYFTVQLKTVLYIETLSKNVRIHTDSRNILAFCSMKSMEEQLRERRFFRIHTSFLVNMDYIEVIEANHVVLRNGEKLPVSKHRKKKFVNVYLSYVGNLL